MWNKVTVCNKQCTNSFSESFQLIEYIHNQQLVQSVTEFKQDAFSFVIRILLWVRNLKPYDEPKQMGTIGHSRV